MSNPNPENPDPSSFQQPDRPDNEFVWSYKGYHIGTGEFVTAMVHFFRAEVSRANVWRQRLDTTTNWAVVSTGAMITVAFTPTGGHHAVVLLNMLLVTTFLMIEARRYRYYELWSSRIRLMETDFFSTMLVPPFGPAADWAESLAENLLHPHFPISYLEAIGRRYRRNYIWIFFLLVIAWVIRLWLLPLPAQSIQEMLFRASIAGFSGEVVLAIFLGYNVIWLLIGIVTIGLQEASGEVLPRYSTADFSPIKTDIHDHPGRFTAWFRHGMRRQQYLAYIITDKEQQVSDHVLAELKRGLTSLSGKGMFTGESHSVLMCALTVTEVNHLKQVVSTIDQDAFVIVTPAQEILGRGFNPLKK